MVCYDISDPKRLRRVHKTMKGFGASMQYSIFRCSLSPRNHQLMLSRLEDIIDHEEDRIMVVNLGPLEGKWIDRMTFLGNKMPIVEDQVYIF